ncbi:MAG: hypothetical protein ABF976_10290 [Acetobacter syzygii]|uniref:hypothetical protein n=1 Tax=Acetobacter syzygii TaxID=146476 RepID=UPI0039EBF70E
MPVLSDLAIDSNAINDGAWVEIDEYPGLKIKSRGYTDAFVDAQNRRLDKAMRAANVSSVALIGNAARRQINAKLLTDFLVVDVEGLFHDAAKTQPVTVDEFKILLQDPKYARLMNACWEAAGSVTRDGANQAEEAEGNSVPPSSGS